MHTFKEFLWPNSGNNNEINRNVLTCFASVSALTSNNALHILPNLSLRDSNDQTVLGLALWNNMFDVAKLLIDSKY